MSGIIVPTHPGNLWSNAFGFTLASSKICIDTANKVETPPVLTEFAFKLQPLEWGNVTGTTYG